MSHTSRLAVAASLLALAASATITPYTPADGSTFTLLPEPQRKIMAIPSYDERLAALKADHDKPHDDRYYGKDRDSKWRISVPLVLRWRTDAGEKGPWKIVLATKPDLSDGVAYWLESGSANARKLDDKKTVRYKWTVPRPNLKLGQTYYWKVWSDIKCKDYSCGSTLNGPCACGKAKKAHESSVASFTTDAQPPRWIAIEGRTKNIRDLGGWKTRDGRRVKQGLVFRGQGLNDNSVNGDAKGANRLMVEDIALFTQTLGVKTDLDLRSGRELADMKQSPLGAGVKLIHHPSSAYNGIFKKNPDELSSSGMKTMAENFRVFCDEKNYPIYFHCIGGADRTGSLAYVLNGILGVDKHDLDVDWEATFYPSLPELEKGYNGPTYWRREQYFDEGFAKYGDANSSWNDRIELYLLDCGVTKEEIAKFRSIMLE